MRPQLAVAEASGLGRERMEERRRQGGERQEGEWEGESLEGHCNQGNGGKAGGPTGSLGPPLRSRALLEPG